MADSTEHLDDPASTTSAREDAEPGSDSESPAPAADAASSSFSSSDVDEAVPAAGRRRGRRRRAKISKWDRPRPPRDWRWAVGLAGRTLIAVGILMFGFVAYQLWGTGIENAAAQRALEDDFEELLEQFDPVAPPTTVVTSAPETTIVDADDGTDDTDEPTGGVETEDPDERPASGDPESGDPASATDDGPIAVPVSEQNIPDVDDGDAIARLEIDRIGLNDIVVAGVGISELKRGPGHFPDTPMPGQLGNAAIAAHRTGHGAPFFEINELEPDDEIRVTTLNGVFVYRVTGQQIVTPSEYGVVATTEPSEASLTLISCHPRYTARERIVISAVLDPDASAPVGEAVLDYGRGTDPATLGSGTLPGDGDPPESPTTVPATTSPATTSPATSVAGDTAPGSTTTPTSTVPPTTVTTTPTAPPDAASEQIADVFSRGWFSDPSANPHVGFWGLVLAAIALLSYVLSRRFRHDWVGAAVGIVPFVVALYFFFQNVNRLLPPNL